MPLPTASETKLRLSDARLTSRICLLCNLEKPTTEFYFLQRSGYQSRCKPCELGRKKVERGLFPRRLRSQSLKHNYGLSLDEWEAKFAAQGSRCASCGTDDPGHKHGWHTDHCHATGRVRGITCHGCNLAVGGVKDSVVRAQALVRYLQLHAPTH